MTDFILPHALPSALDGRANVKLLSLDCFDTLLWRDSHAPVDIFGALPGMTVLQRQWAETRARTAVMMQHRHKEVSIEQIYREMYPNARKAEIAAAVAHELDAEARHCFAFQPTVALIREAKRRGIGVIIVSDTYLDQKQLRELIARAAGAEVANMIERIFCSSTYHKSKTDGLYADVLKALKVRPETILHIGDNPVADIAGVAPYGVQTLHLKQFAEATEQRLRQESSISAMLHPLLSGTIAAQQPHRAALAVGEPRIEDPAESLGFSVMGPVFHAYERWLQQEAAALQAERGGTVHWLFMMRDGLLPMRVHQVAQPDSPAHAVEISRFTAIASSLTTPEAIERYVQFDIGSDVRKIAQQLLLPQHETRALLKNLPEDRGRIPAFVAEIRKPQRVKQIIKAGQGFADRLIAHVRSAVDPAPGDTLMLVDLGYNGSVQNEVDGLLRDRFQVHVAGRYLLLREQFRTGCDKKGLIGEDDYDCHTLEAIATNVAVLEQICTAAQGSTVDFQADGTPIRAANSIKGRQSATRERIQEGTLRFEREQAAARLRGTAIDEMPLWRHAAAAVLGRLMYLPMAHELAVLAEFEHDINEGVSDTVALFDPAIARHGLHQRGLFYMKGSERMYLPAELHGEGLPVKLALLAQKRFGLPLKYADFVDSTISVPVIVADGTNVSTGNVTATPTHNGYYLAPIPIGDCRFSVGVQFGQLFDWVQVESAVFMPVERFLSDMQRPGLDEIEAAPSLEGIQQVAPNLFHCADEFGFMMVPPPPRADDRPMMLALVFRPIANREIAPVETVRQPSPVHAPGVR
ncbi:HAD family hydrolase [Sphingomonas sp. ABOLD]|uniref:FMN phosphatase YigB (HAD superfamily) n=1 Tax=Sphingomonas trueperi TaxID=53317 RepID=A0A7X5XYG5_9SPHN|nr:MULTISPECIES: HAD family hydrolase [unclassified Sphingomonas]NJB97676.1 FMN phosphatase YigB (HAD superfamily) [Sphingomonas trueperi]RSV43512.1 HAD family hydrolase [Sphingomonas sp. ABOLE]RSV52879.1 HAD family hydrolase [Sphingomonas sp. ABOLD]